VTAINSYRPRNDDLSYYMYDLCYFDASAQHSITVQTTVSFSFDIVQMITYLVFLCIHFRKILLALVPLVITVHCRKKTQLATTDALILTFICIILG